LKRSGKANALPMSCAFAITYKYELPRAKATRLPVSTTDSIPLMGYGGLISTGLKSLRPVGTHRLSHQYTI
jgi:hypothetical protein